MRSGERMSEFSISKSTATKMFVQLRSRNLTSNIISVAYFQRIFPQTRVYSV